MLVFQEQDSGGYRIEIRPNCALSWRWTKRLFLFFGCCLGAVAGYFASLGAWLVLPFAGLELVVLGAGLYLNALAGHTREVILIDGPVLRVLRGRRRLDELVSFPANWTQVTLRRDPRGWYPGRLLLRCQGKGLEVGSKLVESEREELAATLQDVLTFGQPRSDRAAAEPIPAGAILQTQSGHGTRAPGADAHALSGPSLASKGPRATGCARGAFTEK